PDTGVLRRRGEAAPKRRQGGAEGPAVGPAARRLAEAAGRRPAAAARLVTAGLSQESLPCPPLQTRRRSTLRWTNWSRSTSAPGRRGGAWTSAPGPTPARCAA